MYIPYLTWIFALASGIHACAADASNTKTAPATAMLFRVYTFFQSPFLMPPLQQNKRHINKKIIPYINK